MTPKEVEIVEALFSRGPRVLFELGYSVAEARAFLACPDVQAEMQLRENEFNNREALEARLRFVGRQSLAKCVPQAAMVLAHALAGPSYVRGPKGEIMFDKKGHPLISSLPPTSTQVTAAQTVLDRVGVNAEAKDSVATQVNLTNMVGMREETLKLAVENDDTLKTYEQQALARERIRNIIADMKETVKDGHLRLKSVMGNVTTKVKKERREKRKKEVAAEKEKTKTKVTN
jgi:hypothetical protein